VSRTGTANLGDAPDERLAEFASLFADNLQMHGATLGLGAAERDELLRSFRDLLHSLTPAEADEALESIAAPEVRHAWLAELGRLTRTQAVQAHAHPVGRRVRFCLYSPEPEHRFEVAAGGSLVDTKVRSVEFFGQHWVYEHNVIVDTVAPARVRFSDAFGRMTVDEDVTIVAPAPGPRSGSGSGLRRLKRLFAADWWQNRKFQFAMHLSRRIGRLRRFENAWAIADRRHQAGDNGEALFRHLHERRPDINAWFVVGRGVPAYRELRRLGAKVLPYGSIRHYLLLARADVFASSQSDPGSRLPFGPFLPQSWLFVYLKHGILHTDHHRRFNPMQIHLVPAATEAERDDLVRDRGRYRFASSEVPLTGMPRLDRLEQSLRERRRRSQGPDVLLIAPTWRIYLASPNADHRWSLREGVERSDYVRNWSELLNDEGLRELCERHGLRPTLLMHPRFQHHRHLLPTPDWITVTDYQRDVSSLFARTRLSITDYSSIAFEAAYADAPTVYFQFDRETFFGGGHSGQQGEYDYEAHGFGPVVTTAAGAVSAVAALVDRTSERQAVYESRIASLYAWRDARNSERTVTAIEQLIAAES